MENNNEKLPQSKHEKEMFKLLGEKYSGSTGFGIGREEFERQIIEATRESKTFFRKTLDYFGISKWLQKRKKKQQEKKFLKFRTLPVKKQKAIISKHESVINQCNKDILVYNKNGNYKNFFLTLGVKKQKALELRQYINLTTDKSLRDEYFQKLRKVEGVRKQILEKLHGDAPIQEVKTSYEFKDELKDMFEQRGVELEKEKEVESLNQPGMVFAPYIMQEYDENNLEMRKGREEYDEFMKGYRYEHALCPICKHSACMETLVAYVLDMSKKEEYKDLNSCTCSKCGSIHTRHDRISLNNLKE